MPNSNSFSELKTFTNRIESTMKALEDENKNLKEENDRLRGMVEGDDNDQSKMAIVKCVICMEYKKLENFLLFTPCGHCFCETVRNFIFFTWIMIIVQCEYSKQSTMPNLSSPGSTSNKNLSFNITKSLQEERTRTNFPPMTSENSTYKQFGCTPPLNIGHSLYIKF